MHSTQDKYKHENVSYGTAWTAELVDGTEIEFSENCLETATKIDERNLEHCLYLQLANSSITELDTKFLCNVRVLVMFFC